jgi:hypothetical protein
MAETIFIAPLQTGQQQCYDAQGEVIDCEHSGQDAAFMRGRPWPQPRFKRNGDLVVDFLTGLQWPVDANPAEFPLDWHEAVAFIKQLNHDGYLEHHDWRLPDRRELRSLIGHQTRQPALPTEHPFENVFNNWYWTSTPAAGHAEHAWYINMDGGRMFYGGTDQAYMVWPVRGSAENILATPTWQPSRPRFVARQDGVVDQLSGLLWSTDAGITEEPVNWTEALQAVARLNQTSADIRWRLPNINELESLVDAACYEPALTAGHPFKQVREIYWSSTTSAYETDWAWALYLHKGAVGVGQKSFARFHVWPVSNAS